MGEMQPFYGQDPSYYALKAKEDANAAFALSPSSGEALLKLVSTQVIFP
jgi:hypothetical protein